jgi:hypothetical protein
MPIEFLPLVPAAETLPSPMRLLAHELRKLFSQEMGIAAKEIHDTGSMLQLKVGSSTGMNSIVVKDNLEFIDEDMSEKTGIKIETPWDVEGADVLLIHNAGDPAGREPEAFALTEHRGHHGHSSSWPATIQSTTASGTTTRSSRAWRSSTRRPRRS